MSFQNAEKKIATGNNWSTKHQYTVQGRSKINNPIHNLELLDRQSPESGPKFSADPQSTVVFKSANSLYLSLKSAIRALFQAKSADPQTYSPPLYVWPKVDTGAPKGNVIVFRRQSFRRPKPFQELKNLILTKKKKNISILMKPSILHKALFLVAASKKSL